MFRCGLLLSPCLVRVDLLRRKRLNLLLRSAWRCGSLGYTQVCSFRLSPVRRLCRTLACLVSFRVGNLNVPSIPPSPPRLAFGLKCKICVTHHSSKPCGFVRASSNACSAFSGVPVMLISFRSCGNKPLKLLSHST